MKHRISTIEELEGLYPRKPALASTGKETGVVTPHYKRLIEACPFAVVASEGPEGLDASPRGDGPGFMRILDNKTLALPDRRGNNRLDTLRNIVRTGRVALLAMIPGLNETLRLNGTAYISTDPELLVSMEERGVLPTSAIIITIETMYFQCARALVRSKLWDAEVQVDPKSLPSAGDLLHEAMNDFDGVAYDADLPQRQAKTLY
ncbi:MAG: pyridoxamine 5'-phosphate oxidase family protein [Pseudomonadota bacterium]